MFSGDWDVSDTGDADMLLLLFVAGFALLYAWELLSC
jgi:hypothetical protein